MNSVSPFVQRMTELLERMLEARTAEDAIEARDEMAEVIKAQYRGERVRPPRIDRDVRQLQTGESE